MLHGDHSPAGSTCQGARALELILAIVMDELLNARMPRCLCFLLPPGMQEGRRLSYTAGLITNTTSPQLRVSAFPAEEIAVGAASEETHSNVSFRGPMCLKCLCRTGRLEGWEREEHVTEEKPVLLEWDPTPTPILCKKRGSRSQSERENWLHLLKHASTQGNPHTWTTLGWKQTTGPWGWWTCTLSLACLHTHTLLPAGSHRERHQLSSLTCYTQLLNDTGRGQVLPFDESESPEWGQLGSWQPEMIKRLQTKHIWDILTSHSNLQSLKWFPPAALLSCFNNQRGKLGAQQNECSPNHLSGT